MSHVQPVIIKVGTALRLSAVLDFTDKTGK